MSLVPNPYDRSAKLLCRERPADFLALVFPGIDPRGIRIENPELNIAEKRADDAYRIDDHTACLIEFMIEPDRRELRRFFVKTALATEVLPDCDVLLIVYYLTPGAYRELPGAYEVVRQAARNRYEFMTVGLWNHRDAIEAGHYPALVPFLTLWPRDPHDVTATLHKVRQLVLAEPDPRVRSDLLSVAMTIACRAIPDKAFLLSFFREELAMMRESTIVDDWVEEGVQKGLEKGREEGTLVTARRSVEEVLEARFDVAPQDVLREVQAITDASLLHQLVRQAAKASSLDEFRTKLALLLARPLPTSK